MPAHSLNDIDILPPQALNKIQKKKIKQLIACQANKPEGALLLVKEYVKRINKIKITTVIFDNDEAPEGVQVITTNATYLFEFAKLWKTHEL
jgi:hypothetical protein